MSHSLETMILPALLLPVEAWEVGRLFHCIQDPQLLWRHNQAALAESVIENSRNSVTHVTKACRPATHARVLCQVPRNFR
jgi:hypothetical protein